MKTIVSILTALLIGMTIMVNAGNRSADESGKLTGSLKIISTPDLKDIAARWAGAFREIHPEADIQVILKDQFTPGLTSSGDVVQIVSGKDLSGASLNDWRVVIARDIVVPVISNNSPWSAELAKEGINKVMLASMLSGKPQERGATRENSGHMPVNLYLSNDVSIEKSLAPLLDQPVVESRLFHVMDPANLIAAVSRDPNGIGFIRFIDIVTPDKKQFTGDIHIVPFDKNGNGQLDYMEDIYDNPDNFLRGVWIGKYPKPLSGEIFAVMPGRPDGNLATAFMQWALSDGQDMLGNAGLCDLLSGEKQSRAGMMNAAAIEPVADSKAYTGLMWIAIMLVVMIVASWGFYRFYTRERKGAHVKGNAVFSNSGLNETSMDLPGGLMYDKTHTWAFMESNGLVKVGIDDFILHVAGIITRIEMKEPGETIKKGDTLCKIIQQGKQLQLYAPVSGVIKSRNPLLAGDASWLNRSPYNQGWIYEVEPANWIREIGFMQMAQRYREWIKSEFTRLRDFIASVTRMHPSGSPALILQDGGVIIDRLLETMEPEVWEDFQTNFLDTNR